MQAAHAHAHTQTHESFVIPQESEQVEPPFLIHVSPFHSLYQLISGVNGGI